MHISAARSDAAARCSEGGERLIQAEWIGSRVPSRFAGCVHSVFRQACNIEADDGMLVTLLAGARPNLPRGVRCSATEPMDFLTLCAPGQAVQLTDAELRIPRAGLAVGLSGAAVWRCTVSSARAIDPLAQCMFGILVDVRNVLSELRPAGGFAPLMLDSTQPAALLDLAIRRRLERTLPVLAEAIGALDADRVVEALTSLVGLGPGLTPSGDDFIVGLLAALWSRKDCRALPGRLREPLGRLFTNSHAISRQFLVDALEGDFSEPLADLVMAISMRNHEEASAAARGVMRIGCTSGADALAGFLFGLQPALVRDRAITN